ncbi:MAG: hypothetical protein IJF73_03665 [Clostridia bacterium]|nr:hypothetical protein [Clostridia bacterium]
MEKKYAFRERMCRVHRTGITDPSVYTRHEGLTLTEEFSIVLPLSAGAVLRHAALDLSDYFAVSHGLSIPVVSEGEAHGPTIRLCVKEDGRKNRAFTLAVDEDVTVVANSEAAVFSATVYLEERMNEWKGPRLPRGRVERESVFSPRMVHSGYGLDEFTEDYLNRLAHDGYDTILIYVRSAEESAAGKTDFNTLIDMAERYGLAVYAYSYIVSEKHPDDEGAEDYYRSTYGRLFSRCPRLAGVIFVGESCEFPSHDERAYPWLYRDRDKHKDEWHLGKFWARNFPVRDYPDWLRLVSRVIREHSPGADIVFWSYNWGGRPAEERVALIDILPDDVTLEATFEMHEWLPAPEGVQEKTTDYTISIPGPGQYFLSEAEAAAKRGLPLYTISNTAGATWDVGIVPYIPAPEVFMERYEALLACHEKYGLTGLMESHHYGAYPSFIAELSKEMGWVPRRDPHEHLAAIAEREFGKENVAKALKAWHHASEGIRHDVPTIEDQYGPLRVGPSYPLVTKTRWVHDSPAEAIHGGGRITYTGYGMYEGFPGSYCLRKPRRVLYEIGEFSRMREEYDTAAALFREIAESLTGEARAEAGRMAALLFLIARTAETTVNTKRWHMLRQMTEEMTGACEPILTADGEWLTKARELYGVRAFTPRTILSLCETIAEEECENARRAIPAVEYDSRLGYEPSMDYMTDKEHILWKCECTEAALLEMRERLTKLM